MAGDLNRVVILVKKVTLNKPRAHLFRILEPRADALGYVEVRDVVRKHYRAVHAVYSERYVFHRTSRTLIVWAQLVIFPVSANRSDS